MAYFKIFRGTQAEVNAQAIIDGQMLYTTDLGIDNKIYADVGSTRTILSNDNGVTQSYTPTASNLGTINIHIAMKKGGIGRYILKANSGNWIGGTTYTLTTLSSTYRPSVRIGKEILLRNGCQCYFTINTNGIVNITPRTSINNLDISIDETYII